MPRADTLLLTIHILYYFLSFIKDFYCKLDLGQLDVHFVWTLDTLGPEMILIYFPNYISKIVHIFANPLKNCVFARDFFF